MDSENPVSEDNRAINSGGESNRRANDAAIPNGHKSPPESIIEMAKTLAGVLVVLLAPFYAAGWSYINQYYKTFGVNSYDLSLPVYVPLLYSISVVTAGWLSAICTSGAVIIIWFFPDIPRVKAWISGTLRIVLFSAEVFIFTVLLSLWGGALAQQRAREHMKELDPTHPMVKVYTELNSHEEGTPAFDRLEYKLLIHAGGQYFIFRPLKEGPATALQLFVIPEHRVRVLVVQRGLEEVGTR